MLENQRLASRILVINFVTLVVLVILPAGGYQLRDATIRVSSLSAPFADYGIFIATSAALLVLFAIVARLYGHSRRVSPLSYVIASGGVLGLMVPDVIASSNRIITISAHKKLVPIQVHLLVGFWLTIATAVLLFAIASVVFFAENKTSLIN